MRLTLLACAAALWGASSAAVLACGTDAGVTPVVQQIDDAGSSTNEGAEEASTTFACGEGNTCNVGVHACCVVGGAHACFPVANGCPAEQDAGSDADAGSTSAPILCLTYNNCGGDRCCYHPDAGAQCMSSCPDGYENLCRRNVDSCGSEDCKSFDESPFPTIGRCD